MKTKILTMLLLSAMFINPIQKGRLLRPAPFMDSMQVIYEYRRYAVKPHHIAKQYRTKGGRFKSYMDYRKIIDKTTSQYRLLRKGKTDIKGFRKVYGRYCIAVGSRFTRKIGTKIDIRLSTGKMISCILADQKSDQDTDHTHSYHISDHSMVEFLVNEKKMKRRVRTCGDVSHYNFLKGSIRAIYVYKK